MSKNLKTALFSSILLLLISYPILGLKLSVVGISLQVSGATVANSNSNANALAAGKRPLHTIIPALVTEADRKRIQNS